MNIDVGKLQIQVETFEYEFEGQLLDYSIIQTVKQLVAEPPSTPFDSHSQ